MQAQGPLCAVRPPKLTVRIPLQLQTFALTAALDAHALSDADEQRVIAGAVAAFARVQDLVETLMPLPSETETTGLARVWQLRITYDAEY